MRLGGATVTGTSGGAVVARHERSARKGAEVLVLDHYLEVLARKPEALPGSSALAQARSGGGFTAAHERFWQRARRRLGDAAGTRALIEVLLLHRRLPFTAVHAALDVSKELFSRVQSLMRSRAPRRGHPRRVGSSYLLSGLVRCKSCRRALSGQDSKSGKFSYYVCQSLLKRGRSLR